MSDSSRSRLAYNTEGTFNEVPSSPTQQQLRFTKEALKHKNSTTPSAEIRQDRERSDLLLLGVDVDGSIDVEFSYNTLDTFLQAALCGTFTAALNFVTDFACTSGQPTVTSNTANFTQADVGLFVTESAGQTHIAAGITIISVQSATQATLSSNASLTGSSLKVYFSQGQITITTNTGTTAFTVSGTGNNIATQSWVGLVVQQSSIADTGVTIATVTSTTAGTLSASTTTGASNLAGLGARGSLLQNGTTNRSFLIEKALLDVTQFFQFRGCAVNQFNLDITARKIVQASIAFMGAQATLSQATVSNSVTAPNTNTPVTAGPYVVASSPNTNLVGIKIKDLKLTINNNLRIHDHVESTQTDDFGRGVMDITGSMDVYFKNQAIFNQFLANSATSLAFTLSDPTFSSQPGGGSAKNYTFFFPKVKLPDASTAEVTGVDADIMQSIQFRALYDSVTNMAMQIGRD